MIKQLILLLINFENNMKDIKDLDYQYLQNKIEDVIMKRLEAKNKKKEEKDRSLPTTLPGGIRGELK